MIRALCMWNLKISAALYVRHFPSYDRRIWGAESKMSLTTLTTMTTIAWICVLSRNRARGWERWRRRCRWCKGWRSCAVAQSSLLLSLLSPPLLLPQWNMQYLRYFLIWCKDTQILEMQKKDWHVSVFGNRKWVWQLWQIIATKKFKQNR